MENYCINCGTDLIASIDNDDAVCAQCQAQDNHDYDLEPDAEFDRSGRLIEKQLVTKWVLVGRLDDGGKKYTNDRSGLSFYVHPERGTYDFLGQPCAARNDGTLTIIEGAETVDVAGKLLQDPSGSKDFPFDENFPSEEHLGMHG